MASVQPRPVRRPHRRKKIILAIALVAIAFYASFASFRDASATIPDVPLERRAIQLPNEDVDVHAARERYHRASDDEGSDAAPSATVGPTLDASKPVFASFVSNGFHEFMLHWYASLRDVGVESNVVVAALDAATEKICQENNVPYYSDANLQYTHEVMATGGTPLHDAAQTKKTTNDGRAFQQIGALKAGFLSYLLKQGHTVLVSDVDVTWLKDPRIWLRGAMGEAEVDMATSTDCLHASNWDIKACWSTPFNTGILYLKPTEHTKAFLEEWRVKLETTENKNEHDQDIFNRMLRAHEGVSVETVGDANEIQVKSMGEGLKLKVGLLSMRLFASGHAYFVQKLHERTPTYEPFAVHTTFQFSQARGKRQRLRESMLWKGDSDAYYNQGNFITMSDGAFPSAWNATGIENHLVAAAWFRLSVRNLLALGKVLNRIVILPKITCMCDRYWGHVLPSCSISDVPPPYDRCPADHIMNINSLEKSRLEFREWSFLNNPRTPDAIKQSTARVLVGSKAQHKDESHYTMALFATDKEVLETLGEATERVLVVDAVVESFCAFEDEQATKAFDASASIALEAESHSCGPDGCFVGFPRPHATASYAGSCEILRREGGTDTLSTLGKFYSAFAHDRNGAVVVAVKSFTSSRVNSTTKDEEVVNDLLEEENPFSAPSIKAAVSNKTSTAVALSSVNETKPMASNTTRDSARYESLHDALQGIGAKAGEDVIFIAFANHNVASMTMNWAKHLQNAASDSNPTGNIKFIVAALDVELLEALREQGVATYPALHENLNQATDHANDNWKTFCRLMISQLKDLLDAGYDAVLSDIDVVWLRNAAPYFKCDDDVDGCANIKAADVMISSDNLSPSSDAKLGAAYARGGIFNTGMMFLRHSANGKDFLHDWLMHLSATSGRFASLTTHQQVINAMARKQDSWPGLEPFGDAGADTASPTRVLESGAPLSTGQSFKLGVLPLKLFTNGHGYFISMAKRRDEIHPYAVHATYTFDGSGGDAKRYRFEESGLWAVTPPATDEMYVTFDVTTTFSGEPNIRDHIAVFKANLNIVRDAIAVAVALNRTLALPPLPCSCDKVWGGHDNIFTFQCHYPGSAEEKYLPSSCPLDHFISPTRLRKSGFKFTPLASLSSANRSEAVTIEGFTGANATVDAVDAFVSASSASRATLINLGDIRGINTTFSSQDLRARFNAYVEAIVPEMWCSECHPQGCANLIDAETLALGRVLPTRQTFDKFCISFDAPGVD